MKDAVDLFFELSNEDRLSILTTLQDKPAKLTQLSNELKLTNQEVSRQLARMIVLDLCYRDGEGDYNLTQYAKHILSLIPGFNFLSKNRLYFKVHRTDGLPREFQLRIGELSLCSSLRDVLTSLEDVRQMICEASDYLWLIQEQANLGFAECLEDAIKRGVEYRVILPSDIIPSEHYTKYLRSWGPDHPMLAKNAERRFLDKLSIGIIQSEKEVAQIIFPTLDGKFDYSGFKAKDEASLSWARDLFRFYWENASKEMPKRIKRVLGVE